MTSPYPFINNTTINSHKLFPICPICNKELIIQVSLTNNDGNTASLCSCTNCSSGHDEDWEIIWNDTEVISVEKYYFG